MTTPKFTRVSLLGTAAFATLVAAAPQAFAQDDGIGLETIFVTSQRRVESVQDIPVAVSAFNEKELAIRNIDNALDIVDYVPNLFGANNTGLGTANAYYLRGLGNTESIATFDPPVGTYIDDIYLSRQNANNFSFFDLDRIEVLRGPQGTLFGRNTTGGAINVILKEPGDEFGGQAEVAYGRFQRVLFRASVDTPISETLSAKFSGFFVDDAGFSYNFVTDERINDETSYGLRGAIKWEPSDVVKWNVSGSFVSSDYQNVINTPVSGNNVGPAGFNGITLGRFAGSGQTTGLPRVSGGFTSTRPGTGRLVDQLLDGVGAGNLTENLLLTSNLTFDFDDVNIEIITGWLDLKQDFILNFFDGFLSGPQNPGPSFFSIANEGRHKQFSQEVKATGSAFDGLIDYVAGMYFIDERNDTELAQFQAVLQYDRLLENNARATAAYAQLDWNLTEQLSLTTGIRFTDEKKTIDVSHFAGSALQFTSEDIFAAGIPTRQNASIWTPRFGLQYELNDDVLLFASATRGFKSGGWNARGTAADTLLNFAPEKVWSYEVGTKSQFFDDRLRINATAFFNDVADVQIPSAFTDANGSLIFINQNFADLEVYGIELEVTGVINEYLTAIGSLGFQDASYNGLSSNVLETQQNCLDFLAGTGTLNQCERGIVTATGDIADPVRTPEITMSLGANGTYPIGNDLQIISTAFAIYTASYETDTGNAAVGSQDGFWRFNGNIGVEREDGQYGIYAECQNCFGKNYVVSALGGFQYFSNPSSWTIRAKTRF